MTTVNTNPAADTIARAIDNALAAIPQGERQAFLQAQIAACTQCLARDIRSMTSQEVTSFRYTLTCLRNRLQENN